MAHRIKEFFKKIKYRFKGWRMKKFNWPLLTTYCGCLSLPNGIYIKSLISLAAAIVTLVPNTLLLKELFAVREQVFNASITQYPESTSLTQESYESLYKFALAYIIIWIIVTACYILFMILTVYSVFMKNITLIRAVLFIHVPMFAADIFHCLFLLMINDAFYFMRIFVLLGYFLELYNFVAIRSYYKNLKGIYPAVVEHLEPEVQPSHFRQNTHISDRNTELHCRTCTCLLPDNGFREATQVIHNEDIPQAARAPAERVDVNNETCSGYRMPIIRPNTLNIELERKVDLSDDPVIYDEQQLNVGSSPVIQDRPI